MNCLPSSVAAATFQGHRRAGSVHALAAGQHEQLAWAQALEEAIVGRGGGVVELVDDDDVEGRGVEVAGASMEHGLLHIDLKRAVPWPYRPGHTTSQGGNLRSSTHVSDREPRGRPPRDTRGSENSPAPPRWRIHQRSGPGR